MSLHERNVVKLKAYSPGELAELYDVNIRTFKRWLEPFKKDIGKRHGRYFTIAQVQTIFAKLSHPASFTLH